MNADQRSQGTSGGDHYAGGVPLPVGTIVGDYEIAGIVGEGGFGIVYTAHDRVRDRRAAVKEYMPGALADREADSRVVVRAPRHEPAFAAGMRSFINEAKMLAAFDHPALVKVWSFWEQNGTAYMAMPLYEGRTLKAVLKETPKPTEAFLRRMLGPLLDALETLHRSECYHRDVSPDNIMLLADGSPVLLDFGAARKIIGNMTQDVTVILKPGFAPIEQYADDPSMRQGPWTDVYAVAAVLRLAVTGKSPPAPITRIVSDTMKSLRGHELGYSARFLDGIDRGLAVRPEHRPQTIAAFREALGMGIVGGTAVPPATNPRPDPAAQAALDATVVPAPRTPARPPVPSPAPSRAPEPETQIFSSPAPQARPPQAPPPPQATAPGAPAEPVAAVAAAPRPPGVTPRATEPTPRPLPEPAAATGSPRANLRWVIVAGVALIVAGLAWTFLSRNAAETTTRATAVAPVPLPVQRERAEAPPANSAPSVPATVATAPASSPVAPKASPTPAAPAGAAAAPASPPSAPAEAVRRPEPAPAPPAATPVSRPPPIAAAPPAAMPPAAAAEAPPKAPAVAARTGKVRFVVKPWGEIVVDGRSRGTSPPLKELALPEGRHRIEIRNAGFNGYQGEIEVKAGGSAVVSHSFQ